MRLTKQKRQEIIDDYLRATRRELFIAAEFVTWLQENPKNPAYHWFEWDQDKAAHAYRVEQARSFVSGLRVQFRLESLTSNPVKVMVSEIPAMISPTESRGKGGGYIPLSGDDPAAMDCYCEEASRALDVWCRRYGSAVAYRGGDLKAVRKLINLLMPVKEVA